MVTAGVSHNLLLGFGFPGGYEWIILLILGLLIFGRRLPEVGRSLGKGIVEFKRGIKGLEDEIEDESSRAPRPQEPSDTPPPPPPAQPRLTQEPPANVVPHSDEAEPARPKRAEEPTPVEAPTGEDASGEHADRDSGGNR